MVLLVQLWPPIFSGRWPKLKKINSCAEKLQSLGYLNMSKSRFYFLTLFRKKNDYIFQYLDYFCREIGLGHKRVKNKILQNLFHPNDSLSTSCKKILVPTFSRSQRAFHKNFNFQVWLLFLLPRLHFWKKIELDCLMQNLMLNRLAPISNPKIKNGKSSYALF